MLVDNVLANSKIVQTQASINTKKVDGESFDTCLKKETKQTVSLNEIFEKAADTYQVPVNLLKAIGFAESSFRVDATSHCGAQGIMQLMPGTAKELGVTDAYDPEQNIMGGAKYISGLMKKYDGNVKLALAAYNAGSGNVAKYGGIPPFKETQSYVVKVTQYMNQEFDADTRVVVNRKNDTSVQNYIPVFHEPAEGELESTINKLDDIFSYDDYELLLKLLKADSEQEEENNKQVEKAYSKVNLNPSVVNLLRSASVNIVS